MANPFKLVGNFFKNLGKGIWKLVKNFLTSDAVVELLASAQGEIVQEIVSELQFENLSSEEKRKEALKRIGEAFKTEGLEFKESLVRLILEVVVARFKAGF